ncbi:MULTISPECIES: NYN domain-containing protein [unclassified Paenibacillus]|uniref:NYN domain-containing protein n=1 Tax=unclassified Paenibacillus TaxID=185978 RepID=UPI001C12519D|nr:MULTISPECIES: NYN domain-containing protein [unclassified Paenibacillus]MBU5443738.1 NYN domain-containing protein [Paenibacillus sp. MSJ-34]
MSDVRDVLLVDGYNMIGSWPELVELARISLQDARDRLLERLAEYQAFSGRRVIVVFDAYKVPGLGASYVQSKVEIHFTKEKETADECIERFVRELSRRRRQIYVATSDSVEQHVAFGQGALRVSARELSIEIEQSRKEVKGMIERDGAVSHKNPLAGKLSPDIRNLFEKWRRGQ